MALEDLLLPALAGGALGFFANKSDQGNNTTTTNVNYPPEVLAKLGLSTDLATRLANLGYTPYGGQRTAPLAPDTLTAQGLARDSTGAYQPALTMAQNFAQSGGTPISGADIGKYMNPYTDAVAGRVSNLASRFLKEQALPQLTDHFIASGGMGGDANREMGERTVRDVTENMTDQLSNLYNTGFNTALGAAGADKTRALSAAGAEGALATTGSNLTASDLARLYTSGATSQGQAQTELNVPYQDYQQAQQWPLTIAGLSGNIANSAPNLSTGSSTTGPSPSPVAGAIGGALTASSLYNNFNNSGTFGFGTGQTNNANANAYTNAYGGATPGGINLTGMYAKGGRIGHPGFKAVQSSIAHRMGVPADRAGAILAASSRNASAAAHKANPNLNRVKGYAIGGHVPTVPKLGPARFPRGRMPHFRPALASIGQPRMMVPQMQRFPSAAPAMPPAIARPRMRG